MVFGLTDLHITSCSLVDLTNDLRLPTLVTKGRLIAIETTLVHGDMKHLERRWGGGGGWEGGRGGGIVRFVAFSLITKGATIQGGSL